MHDAAREPSTRTRVAVIERNTAKAAVLAFVRVCVRKIQATPSVTDAQKAELRITIRDAEPTPVPAPDTRPLPSLVAVSGNEVWVRLADEMQPTSRAKAVGSIGAEVYCFIGENPPTQFTAWRPMGLFTRSMVHMVFASADAGKKLSIAARWITGTGLTGPFCDPIVTRIVGSALEAA